MSANERSVKIRFISSPDFGLSLAVISLGRPKRAVKILCALSAPSEHSVAKVKMKTLFSSPRSIVGQEDFLVGQSSGVRQRENKDYFL